MKKFNINIIAINLNDFILIETTFLAIFCYQFVCEMQINHIANSSPADGQLKSHTTETLCGGHVQRHPVSEKSQIANYIIITNIYDLRFGHHQRIYCLIAFPAPPPDSPLYNTHWN